MSTTFNLATNDDYKKFDSHLNTCTYVKGFKASFVDLAHFMKVDAQSIGDLKNMNRWYNHIKALIGEIFPGEISSETVNMTCEIVEAKKDQEDSDIDLFGSDSEADEEILAQIEARGKINKKPIPIGRSSVVFDIKPYTDEFSIKNIKDIVWETTSKIKDVKVISDEFIKIAYGVEAMRIVTEIFDTVDTEEIIDSILEIDPENLQSVDIASFNKI